MQKRETLILRVMFLPLSIVQFYLVWQGWLNQFSFVHYITHMSMDESTWSKIGFFVATLLIIYPFYLKLPDVHKVDMTRQKER